jgi:hypothetical protein
MSEFLPIAIIGAGLYVVVNQEAAAAQVPAKRDEIIHPVTYRLRPPPRPLKERIWEPGWGQKRHRPYKAFPAPGGLTDHLFIDAVTGQVRTAQQNAGFEPL